MLYAILNSSFLFSFLSFSQTNDLIYYKTANSIPSFNIKHDSTTKVKPNYNYNFKANNSTLFSVYDRNTQLNDVYFLAKDSIYFVKTVNLNACQFIPKDSFNPNGTTNFKAGLIMGVANTVCNLFK